MIQETAFDDEREGLTVFPFHLAGHVRFETIFGPGVTLAPDTSAANDPKRKSRRVLICAATMGTSSLGHLICDGEQRRQHIADCRRRVAGYDPPAPYGCFTGPISGVRTGLANPKKITTP